MWNGITATLPARAQSIWCDRGCDPGTFEEIYHSYSAMVRGICRRMLRDSIEAEDATQDVFIIVLLKLHTFRGDAAFSSWLYRLAKNVVLMRFRRNRGSISLDEFPELESSGWLEPNSSQIEPSTNAVDKIDLHSAIGQLPLGLRRVFILHDIQGYRHKDIAALLGYSVGNSKSQLHRARARLRTLLRRSHAA